MLAEAYGSLWVLIVAPAVIGVAALVLGIVLLARRNEDGRLPTWGLVGGSLLLLVALGIGSCYGLMVLQ